MPGTNDAERQDPLALELDAEQAARLKAVRREILKSRRRRPKPYTIPIVSERIFEADQIPDEM